MMAGSFTEQKCLERMRTHRNRTLNFQCTQNLCESKAPLVLGEMKFMFQEDKTLLVICSIMVKKQLHFPLGLESSEFKFYREPCNKTGVILSKKISHLQKNYLFSGIAKE